MDKLKKINKKKYKILKNPSNLVFSKLLKKGMILGRCKGKMEFGSRALGNRSIIADPSSSETIKKLMKKLNLEIFWMPFAPSVLDKFSKNTSILKKM